MTDDPAAEGPRPGGSAGTPGPGGGAIADVRASLAGLALERDAILLYDGLAALERDPRRAAAFRHIAGNERRHAAIWADRLASMGATVPAARGRPRARVRIILLLARLFGTAAVHELVVALEGDEEATYAGMEATPEAEAIAADEREHAAIWRRLREGSPEVPAGDAEAAARSASLGGGAMADAVHVDGARAARATESVADISKAEQWHKASRSGTLRAIVFGVSDGLLSNASLVMGVAGAGPDPRFVLLAGLAGLLAGAFSMGAGEYISMQTQREVFERQIALERAELAAVPEEEEAELAAIYRAKGFTADEARAIAARLFRDPETALDTLVREELGLDPGELGSPLGAALGSFAAFAVGAAVPVIPYVILAGPAAFAVSVVASLVGLFVVGALVSLLTGRSPLFSGARQVVIGAAAASVTFLVGRVIGVSVGG